jgi:DEAD/DEAH box helicase domain-containing protein
MVKIQPPVVSSPVIRKRKRETSTTDSTSVQNDDEEDQRNQPGEGDKSNITSTKVDISKAKKKKSGKNGAATASEPETSSTTSPTVPWPDEFKHLEKIHRALNSTYTFFCTRKHLATTLDNMKSLLRTNLGFEPSVDDVSKIAALMPKSISFQYVDEAELDVNLGESKSGRPFGRGRHAVDPFMLDVAPSIDPPRKRKQLLLFEYIDGDLKRKVRDPVTGDATNSKTRLRNEALKMPVYSPKQMLNLIEKRNRKFSENVQSLLDECAREGVDLIQKFDAVWPEFVPKMLSRSPSPGPNRAPLPPSIPKERKEIPQIIEEIRSLEWYTGQIVPDGHRVFSAQEAIYGDLNFVLSQDLINALYHTKGIERLYSHQAEAINNLYDGHNVIVSTSTSSGKSLIYQIPVLHELKKAPDTRAMYIFPTKALAQDQKRSLKELLRFLPGLEHLMVETFDGDTPMEDRNQIRDEARIIFTNPDMLHITILPQEDSWRTYLKNLKFVVVDELHVYNGLFGSHVALIMRRLRRACSALGNRHVKFISCSATVANPEEHMQTIFGLDSVKLTDIDGSPSGRKEFICWNTPYKDPGDPTSGRGNSLAEAAKLFCQLILRGVRVIAFARIRQSCEHLINEVKRELTELDRSEVINRVMSYRGGYTSQDRRQIEKEMFEGKLVGIVATTALELGVDIGSLDAVITVGFPYTIANLRQQSGRAGRRNKDSVSILLGDSFPTDQYFMSNPDELFTRPNCELQVDLENMLCLESHIQCAAFEMPIRPEVDEAYFGPIIHTIAKERMRKDKDGFYHCSERFLPYPSRIVPIRDTEDTHFAIIDTTNGRNVVLEDLEASRAFFTIYEGGIFLHQGLKYLVKEFSQERMMAKVERANVSWTTQQRDYTDIDPVETDAIRRIPDSPSKAYMGPIRIKQVVYGFFKMDSRRRILDAVQVDNDPIVLYSQGFWLDVPQKALEILVDRRLNIAAAIHAAEHTVLSLMPNFVISMPGDVRTECKISTKEFAKKETTRKRPARLTFYDAKGGATGSGISTRAFEHIDMLLRQATERLSACHCLEGCLECCYGQMCKDANQVISKAGAEVVLKSLLNWEIDVDALPMGPEDIAPAGIETVVAPTEVRPARGKTLAMVEVASSSA